MKLLLLSSNGIGAGKTTFAEKFGGMRMPLANTLRKEVARQYPDYSDYIFSTKQEDKAFRMKDGRSIRELLVEYGQSRCAENKTYWCEKWAENISTEMYYTVLFSVVVDDLRKKVELDFFRKNYPGCVHFHIKYGGAIAEKEFDDLEEYADYVIYRR